ncbi:MAG: cytidylyltransferase domain-containing protein [Spirochaetota bacterium]
MTGVFLQARLGSSRLANKALLELGGYAVVEHAMRSLRRLPAARHVLLTDEASAALLRMRAERCGFELFVGPEDNVLERFVLAAREYGVEEVVRATGDNPLVSWELARMAVALRRRERADYVGYDGPPLGTGVEVVTTSALETALSESDDSYDLEHVSPYLYRTTGRFTVVRVPAPPAYCLPNARVTLDTPDDYAALVRLFDRIYDGTPVPVLRLVRTLRDGSMTREDAHAHSARA